jgi:hypothetical protein
MKIMKAKKESNRGVMAKEIMKIAKHGENGESMKIMA